MWSQWSKSPSRTHSATNSPLFRLSSFKDLQTLCEEEQQPAIRQPQTPKKASIFHRVRISTSILRALSQHHRLPPPPDAPPTITARSPGVVVYFTSLRVVRKSFEDCRAVRSILKGFRISIDERDLSMDPRFQDELQGILGHKKLALPSVFIGGKLIGGADEIRQLHESGELKKLIQGLPFADPGVCDQCGGHRFVLCEQCNGSHKVYVEKSGAFRSCSSCKLDGLIRCPSCT